MGIALDHLRPDLVEFIGEQPLFFVASAPSEGGHVNLSPKGYDTFRVIDDRTVAYLDLTGSGIETVAHLRENGRITVMFCSFGEKPMILRLFGIGRAVLPGDDEFDGLMALFAERAGLRAIIRVALDRIQTSCGYAVPQMDLLAERSTLIEWAEARDADALDAYRSEKNSTSIDGLPALDHT